MAKKLIVPKLSDITQDIAGPIPVDLIQKWTSGVKSKKTHTELLAPHVVRGTVVVSDSSGLSRLSRDRSLLDVMWLIHKPKESIYSYGKAIGGRGIGVWAADNTQMFYDQKIDSNNILNQLVCVQKSLRDFPMKVGFAVHTGEFLEIGGGLYGAEADMVESIGETHTDGGEITVTEAVKEKLAVSLQKLLVTNNNAAVASHTYDLLYTNLKIVKHGESNGRYPGPFPDDFYDFLSGYDGASKKVSPYNRYSKRAVVILAKIRHPQRQYLLDTLSDWVLANTIIDEVVERNKTTLIKSNGSLAIFVAPGAREAIDFARILERALLKQRYYPTLGIVQGEVLVFPLENGGFDIAGEPVNIASKLAEDGGFTSGIMIEESVAIPMKKPHDIESFRITSSGVDIRGIKI